jgi:hypothetical protein
MTSGFLSTGGLPETQLFKGGPHEEIRENNIGTVVGFLGSNG